MSDDGNTTSVRIRRSSKNSSSSDDPLAEFNLACNDRLKELNMSPGEKMYIAPTAPGTTGRPVDIQTNIFGIELNKETLVYQYVVHAKADLTTNKEAVFTKKGKEDYIVRDRHKKCCAIIFYAIGKNGPFFKCDQGNHVIYDGQSCMYTTMDLFPDVAEIPDKKIIMDLDGTKMNHQELKNLPNIFLEIHAAKKETFMISSEKIRKRTADTNLKANNRAYVQFLELILNQRCVSEPHRFGCFEHGKVFCLQPWNDEYKAEDCPNVGDGKMLLPGFKKSVQFIEGPQGRGENNPSVVIDAMKAAFHTNQKVIQKVQDILQKDPSNLLSDTDRERVTQVIKGLHVFSEHTGRVRTLRIEGLYKGSAANSRFELPGGNATSVQKYYRDKYEIELQCPNANLLVCKERGNSNYYPIELMTIHEHQRVTIPQQTSAQSQKTTKECAVLPLDRQRLIMKGKNAADIRGTNALLEFFGIDVCELPIMVSARSMDGKDIQAADNRSVKSSSGKWRSPQGSYLKPAQLPSIWAAYVVGTNTSRFTQSDLQNFLTHFTDACQKKGIRLCQPADYSLVHVDKIEEKLQFAVDSSCKFVFVISEDSITHLHQKFKLIEREHEMIIQDMRMSKALSVIKQNKHLTMENVVNKTNVKLGGLNYSVNDSKKSLTEDQLVIGVGVSNPPAGKFVDNKVHLNPIVIGFSSNAKAVHEFSGDFIFGPAGQDTLGSIEDVLRDCIQAYEKNRERLPKRIILYRSGGSEGSHASIISYEIQLARGILEEYNQEIKLIYIMVTKDHTYRFFKNQINPSDKTTEQNIPSGIVLDSGVTHPACKQFFLNSHTTLQGSAKTPLYTVLHDDCKAPMDRLEELTYTLCHHHQIVALTTSVPTPLYVANEYAKRGRNLWVEKMGNIPVEIGTEGLKNRLRNLTIDLGYKTSGLVDKRINA